jgi:hypothetical protein
LVLSHLLNEHPDIISTTLDIFQVVSDFTVALVDLLDAMLNRFIGRTEHPAKQLGEERFPAHEFTSRI